MKGFFIRITVQDPYPKSFEYTIKASDIGTAIRRAVSTFRKKEWAGRHLKNIAVYAAML